MKLLILFTLLWATTFSRAALFDFSPSSTPRNVSDQANGWAVDLAAARQWYLAWAASTDRVYQNLINPSAKFTKGPINPVSANALVPGSFLLAIAALFAAALLSAVSSVSKVLVMRAQAAK